MAVFKTTISGKSAHGSEPRKGLSAITDTCKFTLELQRLFDKLVAKEINSNFENPKPTLNIGRITGGDALNKVPEKALLEFETRYTSQNQIKKILQITKKISSNLKCEINTSLVENIPNFRASKEVRRKVSGIKKLKGASYVTEASIYTKSTKNIIIFGPGDPGEAHKCNESIKKQDIYKYEELLGSIMRNLQ